MKFQCKKLREEFSTNFNSRIFELVTGFKEPENIRKYQQLYLFQWISTPCMT